MTSSAIGSTPYSFLASNKRRRAQIRRFSSTISEINKDSITLTHTPSFAPAWLHQNRGRIAFSAVLYQKQADAINPALMPYLSAEQKAAQLHIARMALWTQYLQYRIDVMENRTYQLGDYTDAMQTLQQSIAQLERLSLPKKGAHRMQANINAESSPAIAYLGQPASNIIVQLIKALQHLYEHSKAKFGALMQAWKNGKTKLLTDWMSELNGLRLYWVWGNSLLDVIFTMAYEVGRIDETFYNYLEGILQSPNAITGNMSWILYYARFAISLGLLLKHTIPHPYMSEEERQIPWTQRLSYQWNHRKFGLLNDGIWASANLACYFWLSYGISKKMGLMGDYLTAILLIMDITLTIISTYEQVQEHDAMLKMLQEEKSRLEQQIATAKNNKACGVLRAHLNQLEKRIAQTEFDWYYQKISLANDVFYAVALLIAFSVLIGLFVPGGQLMAPAMVLAGAISCFVLTVLYNAVANFLPVMKTRGSIHSLQKDYQDLRAQWNDATSIEAQKGLFIQLMDIQEQISHHSRMGAYQIALGIHGLLLDSLTPVVVLMAIAFLPLTPGIAVISASILLAVGSKYAIHQYAPPAPEKCHLNEEAFRLFKKEQEEKREDEGLLESPEHEAKKT